MLVQSTSSGVTLDDLTRVLFIGSAVLLVAVGAVRLSVRSGFPSLLIYLGIGLALGNAGAGIEFDDASTTAARPRTTPCPRSPPCRPPS